MSSCITDFSGDDLVKAERRHGRHLICVEKVKSSGLLAVLNPSVSFFYKISLDGRQLFFCDSAQSAASALRAVEKHCGIRSQEEPE